MNAKLFINYRREDSAPYVGRLYDRLIEHFDEDQVFRDIENIGGGEDFVETIKRKISACDIAIVAIGPNWLDANDASGGRRLDNAKDFVRMEIVTALQRKIHVIPVLVGGALMPRPRDLPRALAPLSRRNAIELSETRFHDDVDRLIEAIEKFLRENSSEFSPGWRSERDQQDSGEPTRPEGSTVVWTKSRLIRTMIGGFILLLALVILGALKTPKQIIQMLKSKETIQMLKNIEEEIPKKIPRIP